VSTIPIAIGITTSAFISNSFGSLVRLSYVSTIPIAIGITTSAIISNSFGSLVRPHKFQIFKLSQSCQTTVKGLQRYRIFKI
jgi:hypothetical protein